MPRPEQSRPSAAPHPPSTSSPVGHSSAKCTQTQDCHARGRQAWHASQRRQQRDGEDFESSDAKAA
eukprot:12040-Eustigmatos_ZCMA.PRE.1